MDGGAGVSPADERVRRVVFGAGDPGGEVEGVAEAGGRDVGDVDADGGDADEVTDPVEPFRHRALCPPPVGPGADVGAGVPSAAGGDLPDGADPPSVEEVGDRQGRVAEQVEIAVHLEAVDEARAEVEVLGRLPVPSNQESVTGRFDAHSAGGDAVEDRVRRFHVSDVSTPCPPGPLKPYAADTRHCPAGAPQTAQTARLHGGQTDRA